MGKQLFSILTVLILLFAVSLTVGSVSAAPNATNGTIISDVTSQPTTTTSIIANPSIDSTSAVDPNIDSVSTSDLVNYLTPDDPSIGYVAIIEVQQISVSLERIVVAYIPTSALRDGQTPESYIAELSNPTGNVIVPTPTNTGTSNTDKPSCKPSTTKPATSKTSTCKPKTSVKPVASKPSTCKPKTSVKPASTCKPKTSVKPASTCKPKSTSSSKPSTCNKTTKTPTPKKSKC
jgi:hypothetical protein